ncbi:hypothetical protein JD844_004225 [Phrynosoma platyrhinos]|uniref:Palmitoyltransferase n=1 Tax=Phrynosoma platyrhinos TaxID=52577 RepID=A0ABQ7TMH6_PHRPL|nr:hypothetical protein JD844_004225 [Phrynosoma platyrhinos]
MAAPHGGGGGALRCCRRVFGWVPVLVIALVALWSYYAYVFELCLGQGQGQRDSLPFPLLLLEAGDDGRCMTLTNSIEKVAYLTIFHVIFILFVWTYWKSIFTPPQQPDKKFHMSYADKERYENEERPEGQRQILAEMARKLPVYTRTGNGGIRFCDRCQLIKPDRCHHCSVCAMVNNCIGFSNYKFFLLFLAYSLFYCMFIAATGELAGGRSKFHVLFLLFVSIMFFVSLMFLFGYHCWLVSQNRSTLEAFSAPIFPNGPDKNGFNLGLVKNLQQVFGEEKRLWLFPIVSSQGDGHFFPTRSLSEARNPLLANEEQWEEDGMDDNSHGKAGVGGEMPPLSAVLITTKFPPFRWKWRRSSSVRLMIQNSLSASFSHLLPPTVDTCRDFKRKEEHRLSGQEALLSSATPDSLEWFFRIVPRIPSPDH